MESPQPQPRKKPTRREGTASTMQIVLTLVGVLVGVALLGWGVFAVAGQLTAPPAPAPATTAVAAATKASKPATTPDVVKTDSAIPSEPATATPAKKPVAVTPAPTSKPKATPPPAPAPVVTPKTSFVVVIDPGHQLKGNNSPEPIGPGSSQTKAAVAGGASGVATRRPESLDNLEISLKIRDALQAQGVKVIMVRTKQDVNIPNSKRAKIANDAHANLFLRVHCDSGPSNVTGFLTLVPSSNKWTAPIVSASNKAGRDIHRAAIAATGANDRGVGPRGDLSGFNWSKVPSVLIECGMMSNAGEDRKLASGAYQEKIAQGVSAGVMRYLHGQ